MCWGGGGRWGGGRRRSGCGMRPASPRRRTPPESERYRLASATGRAVPLGCAGELGERIVEERLSRGHVALGPKEGQPNAVAHEHLCLLELLARNPPATEVAHQHFAQVRPNGGHRMLVDGFPQAALRELLAPEIEVGIRERLWRCSEDGGHLRVQQRHEVLGKGAVMLESALQILHVRGQGGVSRAPLLGLGVLPRVELGYPPFALVTRGAVYHTREERSQVRGEAGLHGGEHGTALVQ